LSESLLVERLLVEALPVDAGDLLLVNASGQSLLLRRHRGRRRIDPVRLRGGGAGLCKNCRVACGKRHVQVCWQAGRLC